MQRLPPRAPRPAVSHALTVAGVALLGTLAHASPLDDPHIGGIGFSGPATGDLAAVYWNPAAVGLIGENQAMFAASGRFASLAWQRRPIDPATGAPGGARSFPEATGSSHIHPITWPTGPGGMIAVAAALGSRVSLGLGAYSPFAQRYRWSADSPARFHAVDVDVRHIALVPALAIRLGGGVRIGAAPGFLFSVGRLRFDEDTALSTGGASDCAGAPCGAENPQAIASYDIGSELDPFSSSLAFTLAGGVHLERETWAAGLTYISRPLGVPGEGVQIGARRSRIDPPPRDPAPLCGMEASGPCLLGQAQFALPDTFAAGFTYHLSSRLDLGVVVRWLNLSRHRAVNIRVVGPASGALRTRGLPDEVVLYRGFKDTIDVRPRAVWRLHERVELALQLRAESSAVPAGNVSPAAVDGFKLEPGIGAVVRLGRSLALTGGYAFAFMFPVSAEPSAFNPQAAVACTAAGGDLNDPACLDRTAGRARPSAAGRYSMLTHAISLALATRL